MRDPELLIGWKAIAEFLDVSEDTAKAWHRRDPTLPVSTSLGSVTASRWVMTWWWRWRHAGARRPFPDFLREFGGDEKK